MIPNVTPADTVSYFVIDSVPDFRSPGGMYDTLRPELITATEKQRQLMKVDPTYVVERGMFFENSFPYLEVRRPFILGTRDHKWKATIAHRFAELLHKKTNKLTRVYTQNIDGLDRQCDIPDDKIVNVHGTLSRASCESCGTEVDFEDFCKDVEQSIKDIYNIDSIRRLSNVKIVEERLSNQILFFLVPVCQRTSLQKAKWIFQRQIY